MASKKIPTLL